MAMKLNISYPQHGSQKLIELDDEKKTRLFYDKRMAEEVTADALGDEWKGYVLKITGGHDKQGFAMKQGVLLNHRTRLLLDGSTTGFHPWKRPGHRKRKSVRGCIIGPDIAVINAIIIKKGEQDLPGLTNPDSVRPSLRGPKRASNIRKLWGLTKADDVRQFVSRKRIKDGKNGKPRYKSPKIQRLVTPLSIHRKKRRIAIKKQRSEKSKKAADDYAALLANIRREKRKALIEKRRAQSERKSSRRSERKSEKGEPEKPEKPEKKEKKERPQKPPKEKKEKPQKPKKTKKGPEEQGEGKAKRQKKDTSETSETSKSKGKPKSQPEAKAKKDQPAQGKAKEQKTTKPAEKPAQKTSEKTTKPAEKPAEKTGEKTQTGSKTSNR